MRQQYNHGYGGKSEAMMLVAKANILRGEHVFFYSLNHSFTVEQLRRHFPNKLIMIEGNYMTVHGRK